MRTLDYVSISILENLSNILEYDDNVCQSVSITYPYTGNEIELEGKPTLDKIDHLPGSENIKNVFGYKSDDAKVFGYDKPLIEPKKLISKALIKKSPERRFLKSVGLLNDNQNSGGGADLPIIAFFKSNDNVIRDCIIEEIATSIQNGEEVVETFEKYKVSDIKALGHYGVINYIYVLTPFR